MPNPNEFVFEIDKAIRTQVTEKLEDCPELSLTTDVAPASKGVYTLYFEGKLVYAGKALRTTLRRRLNEHLGKIEGRRNISVGQMTCRFLIIESDWFVRAAEDALITKFPQDNRRFVQLGGTLIAAANR